MATDVPQLARELEAKHEKVKKGWVFEFIYPGYPAYHSPGGTSTLLFMPDWEREGVISLQLSDMEGDWLWSLGVPYQAPLTAEKLLAAIDPYLELIQVLEEQIRREFVPLYWERPDGPTDGRPQPS